MKTIRIDIPYRLETREDIVQAKKIDLLGLGIEYDVMRAVSQRLTLVRPPVLEGACTVTKEFHRIKVDRRTELRVHHVSVGGYRDDGSFPLAEQALPWAADVAGCADLTELLQTFPPEIAELCKAAPAPAKLTERLESVLAVQKLIRAEALALSHTGRPKRLTGEDLKRLIVGRTLLEPANEDVLAALRGSTAGEQNAAALYQHGLCELLFTRVPSFIKGLGRVEPRLVRQKILGRIAKLGAGPRERMALFAYFPAEVPESRLFSTAEKVAAAARKLLSPEQADALEDHIKGLRNQTEAIKGLYERLFLTPELKHMRRLHRPGPVQRVTESYHETTLRTNTVVARLEFYPTKDYMDLAKARFSSDCTGLDLSEKQLSVPAFFNIRIFQEDKWFGNIYMLDLTREQGVLIVDRIQIPRKFDAGYINFFRHLKEIFRTMFAAAEYSDILLPLSISNHEMVQKAWNVHRKKLTKKKLLISAQGQHYFESTEGSLVPHTFYVLDEGGKRGEERTIP